MRYKIEDIPEGKRLVLSRPLDSINKWIDLVLMLLLSFGIYVGGWIFLDINAGKTLFPVIVLGCIVAGTIGTFRLLGEALKREYIDFTEGFITHTIRKLSTRSHRYDVRLIHDFRHLPNEEWIGSKSHSNKIAFQYEGNTIVLGDGVFSWDFEVLNKLFAETCRNDLRFTDETEAAPGFSAATETDAEADFDRRFQEKIDTYGLGVIQVPDSDVQPAFAFTVGLWQNFRHPELICVGLSLKLMHDMLNLAADLVREGKHLQTDTAYEGLLEDYKCMFVAVHESYYPGYLGYANWYNKGKDYPCLQLVWPDKSGLFPDDPDTVISPYRQPMLDRNVEFKFLERKEALVYVSSEWQKGNAFIRKVIHDEHGDWTMLSNGDDMDVVALPFAQVVKEDLSLNELFNLDYGEEAERDAPAGKWTRKYREILE